MWILYILLCDQKTYYVGITTDLENRITQHKSNVSFYTKRFSKVELVYTERYSCKEEASKREHQIKKWSKAKKQALINGDLTKLVRLAKHC